MFSRAKHTGYFSIEKVFQTIHAALPGHIHARIVTPPVHAQGLWARLVCLAHAATHRSTVNHITGDISFVALALPGDRTIVTVHDFDRLYRLSGIRAAIFRTLYFTVPFRHCKYITTISSQIANELVRLFPWAAHKMVVIADCLPSGFAPVPRFFNAARPVVLQIGTKPNKNIESLIQALEGQPCELHVIGQLTKAQRDRLAQCRIVYKNSVDLSEADLRKAYAESDIVAFVSTYEGFGLPILEANAIGRPVITANLAPMCEVAGDAACMVDPYNVTAIREGIVKIMDDAVYREGLVNRGFENICRFSAVEIARQFATLYESIVETPTETRAFVTIRKVS